MKTEIIKQKTNPFMCREEMTLRVLSEITPTKEELKKEVGKDPELTIIKKIEGNFGKQEFIVDVEVYESKEAREKYEIVPKKVKIQMEKERKEAEAAEKKKLEEEKAAEEAARAEEEKVEEASTEEVAEEPKEEEKKEESQDKPEEKSE